MMFSALIPHDPVPFLIRLGWLAALTGVMWFSWATIRRNRQKVALPHLMLLCGVGLLWFSHDLFVQLRRELFDVTASSVRALACVNIVGIVLVVGAFLWLRRYN